jgi:hypothetical protein
LSPGAEQWCLALRDAKQEDIGNGISIVDFHKHDEANVARADETWNSNPLLSREDEHAFQSSHTIIDNWENIKSGEEILVTGLQELLREMKTAFQEERTVVFDRCQGRVVLIILAKGRFIRVLALQIIHSICKHLDVQNDPKTFLLADPSGRAANQRGCSHTLSTICEDSTLPNNVYGQLDTR